MVSLELNMKIHKETKHNKTSVFNVRNKNCQNEFFKMTSQEGRFTKCFKSHEESINVQFLRWKRMLDKSINACFRKIRVKKTVDKSNMDKLMLERKVIMNQTIKSKEDVMRVEEIEKSITDEIAEEEFKKLNKILGEFESQPNNNMWKELRKAYPKQVKSLPTGVKDFKGKVITNPLEKKKVTIEHFKHRMRKRPYIENVKDVANLNEELFKERLKSSKENISLPFQKKRT